MRLKTLNESPFGGFVFFFHNEKLHQTDQVQANGLDTLTDKTAAQFRNLGMEVPENLREIIEHQICLRQPNPTASCWSGGLGDDLHHKWIGPFLTRIADSLDGSTGSPPTAPPFPDKATRSPKRVFRGFISKAAHAVAQTARRVASCGSCGGSRTYRQGSNNLGRAGSLNKL